jgi:hypothetical protein
VGEPVRLTGGDYQARSLVASAQRCVNLYSEPLPAAQGEPAPMASFPTPGLRLLATLPTAPVRGVRLCPNGTLYAVAGNTVYSVAPDWSFTALGTITAGLVTPVGLSDNSLTLTVVDGTAAGWAVTLAGNTFAQITDPTGTFVGADRCDYLDTFLLFNKPKTPQFIVSGSLAVTFDPLDFANKSSGSDLLVTLCVAKREIWLLGALTTEVWYNTGGDGTIAGSFQFSSMPGVFIPHGCAAKYSVATIDNRVYWLSRTREGQGIVVEGGGYAASRISTYALEAELQTYARIDDAVGYTYQLAGHLYYVMAFPSADKTWAYDLTTKLWHELVWLDSNGTEHRHRGNCAAAAYGEVVIGDWFNGNLYALDTEVYTDNGQPIKRLRHFPHLLSDGKRVFFHQLLADMETGTGGNRLPEPPQVSLAWSDDRGHSFGSPVLKNLGASGEYLTSLQWRRLGMGRDRVFQLQWSSPNRTVLQGAWIDAAPAAS